MSIHHLPKIMGFFSGYPPYAQAFASTTSLGISRWLKIIQFRKFPECLAPFGGWDAWDFQDSWFEVAGNHLASSNSHKNFLTYPSIFPPEKKNPWKIPRSQISGIPIGTLGPRDLATPKRHHVPRPPGDLPQELKALDDKYLAIEKEYEKAVQVWLTCGKPGKLGG